jgi:crotonobetaine/carnitine-CoA ligase
MAEIGGFAIMNTIEIVQHGSIGKVRNAYDIKIFNEKDCEVPNGEVGEIVVRPNVPFSMFTYYKDMEKNTVNSMRNLWFHTGDLAKKDDCNYFYFIGRKKSIIRKNGENISGYEIENIVQQHEMILENAVVPIPDEVAGEEIKLCVVIKEGFNLSYEELMSWLEEKLPKHMVPRYLEFKKEFEKTSSEKIKLQHLIDEGTDYVIDLKTIKK